MARIRQKKAKIAHRRKIVRRRRILKKSHKSLPLLVLLGALIAMYLSSSFFAKGQNDNRIVKLPAKVPFTKDAIKTVNLVTPYPTVTVTPTPTPSPAPLTGYCLKVPVLMYHHIQPEVTARELGQTSLTVDNAIFDEQMAYLVASGYTPIWANELIDALRNHTGLSGKPILVTMDDGYADNDTYALPILRKYNIKANLMLASGLVGSNPDMLTWSQVNDMKVSGLIYITNHTWSHWSISKGPQDKIDSEIDTAQTQIQQYAGQTVNIFTYPYGSFNNNAIETLQRKGYVGAFSEIPGQYQCDSFIMTLHRTRIGNGSLAYYGI
jgi:peptidoglycan/xylan/chitin deacetylase (PgdA/CDA1 family)